MAVLRDPAITAGIGLWAQCSPCRREVAPSRRARRHRDGARARVAILTGSAWAIIHRDLIIALACREARCARHLPAGLAGFRTIQVCPKDLSIRLVAG